MDQRRRTVAAVRGAQFGRRLLASCQLNVGDFPVSGDTDIQFDIINDDFNLALVSPVTTITAPTGTLFAIASSYTRDFSVGDSYFKYNILVSGVIAGRVEHHGTYYMTTGVSHVIPMSAGETIKFSAYNIGTTVRDAPTGVAFYG